MILLQLRVVPPGLVGFDHVDEVGQGLLLRHGDGLEVSGEELRQLGLVEAGARGQLEVLLVPPESVHLQLEQVDVLPGAGLGGDRLTGLLALPSLPLGSDGLNEGLVVLTDVHVVRLGVELQPEPPLGHHPLDLLAVGGVTWRPVAGPAVLQEGAELAPGSSDTHTGLEREEREDPVIPRRGTLGHGNRVSILSRR